MPNCFDNLPWRSVKGLGGMASAMLKVGDYKNEMLKDGTRVRFQIIDFNHDVTPDGIICPITFDLVDCLNNRFSMNPRDTNEGSWEKTRIRQDLNNEDGRIYRLLPDDILELAEPVVKLTADTYNGENTIIKTVDKFFLLSEKERYGRCFGSAPGEGKWYEYYRQEDVSWGKRRNGSPEYTLLRSPRVGSTGYFCRVYTDGCAGISNAGHTRGVSFGFSF